MEVDGEGMETERYRNVQKNERQVFLTKYIDATLHLASVGNEVKIWCVNNFKILFR